MRKIIYICDRCGAEIDGAAACFDVYKRLPDGKTAAEADEITELFTDPAEATKALETLAWDYCGECMAAILRKAAGIKSATVKTSRIPDAPQPTRGRPRKSSDADALEAKRAERIREATGK